MNESTMSLNTSEIVTKTLQIYFNEKVKMLLMIVKIFYVVQIISLSLFNR